MLSPRLSCVSMPSRRDPVEQVLARNPSGHQVSIMFDQVTAACDNGYEGTAVAKACSVHKGGQAAKYVLVFHKHVQATSCFPRQLRALGLHKERNLLRCPHRLSVNSCTVIVLLLQACCDCLARGDCSKVTDGYEVTETDLRVDEFEVKASCAAGYTGDSAAKASLLTLWSQHANSD